MFKAAGLSSVCFLLVSLASVCAAGEGAPIDKAAVEQSFGRLPLYFIENQGQIDSDDVAFYVKGSDKTLWFTPQGITFALSGSKNGEGGPGRWIARLGFVGAREGVRPEGQEEQKAVFSYFKGAPCDWKTALPTFSRLAYNDLWPGIDLVYSGTVNALKYEFVVAPGADPALIRLAYEGVTDLAVSENGELHVETGAASFADGRPYAYQTIDGKRREVPVGYALADDPRGGARSYGFAFGALHRRR